MRSDRIATSSDCIFFDIDGSSAIGQFDQHLDQDAGAGGEVLRGGILDFVVADPALAGNEDHAGGAEMGDVHGVVAGARGHVHVAELQRLGLGADEIDHHRIEVGGRHRDHAFDAGRAGRRPGGDDFLQLLLVRFQHRVVGMAHVDGEGRAARHRVGRARRHLDAADGEAQHVVLVGRRLVHRLRDAQCRCERILAGGARRRAGMRLLALGGDDIAAAALDGGDDADGLAVVLQSRPLFDMGLDIAVEREARPAVEHRGRGGLQRVGERVLQHDALPVLHLQHLVEVVVAREHRRAHGAGLEARAFLVGPGDGDDGAARLHAGILERFQGLERGQHAIHAVEAAAGRLAVHVRAAHHRPRLRVGALAAHEQVADRVGGDREAARPGPGAEQVAGRGILGRQRLPVDAALRRAAQLRHVGVPLPQPVFPDRVGRAHPALPSLSREL